MNGASMVDHWRKSIVGLIGMAEEDIKSAKRFFEVGNLRQAVVSSLIGVDRVSRALIHCSGSKPDFRSGQEEASGMLMQGRRFSPDEKTRLREAIDGIGRINACKIVSEYIASNRVGDQFLDRPQVEQIIEVASKIVILFRQLIVNHFAAEIRNCL
jgi:hypothetical protein